MDIQQEFCHFRYGSNVEDCVPAVTQAPTVTNGLTTLLFVARMEKHILTSVHWRGDFGPGPCQRWFSQSYLSAYSSSVNQPSVYCKRFVKCEGKCPCQPWYSTKWESFAPGVCKFIADLAPVCGADGRTYDECTADGKFWPHPARNQVSLQREEQFITATTKDNFRNSSNVSKSAPAQ